jgi:hypothetical protein
MKRRIFQKFINYYFVFFLYKYEQSIAEIILKLMISSSLLLLLYILNSKCHCMKRLS